MSYINKRQFDCYWGKSGTLDMIVNLMNDERESTIAGLLNGERAVVSIDEKISLKRLTSDTGDEAFYSLLVQSGYLALDERLPQKETARLSIPNKELLAVWKSFIFKTLYAGKAHVRTLFDNAGNLDLFAKDLEYFLCDRLSYHDLAAYNKENKNLARDQHERVYHVFMLGILSAYDDVRCKHPLSNRESGDGRYDILVEKPDRNYIFEFKACGSEDDLDAKADEALAQIEVKRYGAELGAGLSVGLGTGLGAGEHVAKPLVKVGVAFCGKLCRVKCR
jgi:hypothetical protein